MKTIWNIFRPEVLLANFQKFANEIKEKSGIDDVFLSYHPMRVMNSKYFVEKVNSEELKISSIDTPDVVGFFDSRMIGEFFRKQTFGKFLERQKAHVGWRLLNLPTDISFSNRIRYLAEELEEVELIRANTSILYLSKDRQQHVLAEMAVENNCKIAFEFDSFQFNYFDMYLKTIKGFERTLKATFGEDKQCIIGLSLDPAHFVQGQAMGKWDDPFHLLEEIKKSGLPVFSLDYDPVQILNKEKFDSGEMEKTEEAMDEVIKLHCHPDDNVFDYPKYLREVLELFGDTMDEVVIEINPMDRNNIGDKFFEDIEILNNICQKYERSKA